MTYCSSATGVSLALRYWAGSYDDQDTVGSVVASTVHASLNRWTSFPTSAAHIWTSTYSALHFGQGNEATDFWLQAYCVLAAINLAFYALRTGFFLQRGVVASRVIYVQLIGRILSARTRFFDSTPTGRILNRLSKDVETIDQELAPVAMFLLLEFLGVVGIIGSISAVLPAFLFAAVVITAVYFGIGYIYLASSRELKRSESVSRSPIFSLFGETLNGVSTIRVRAISFFPPAFPWNANTCFTVQAYSDSARFTKQVFSLLNITNRPFFTLWQGNRCKLSALQGMETLATDQRILPQGSGSGSISLVLSSRSPPPSLFCLRAPWTLLWLDSYSPLLSHS